MSEQINMVACLVVVDSFFFSELLKFWFNLTYNKTWKSNHHPNAMILFNRLTSILHCAITSYSKYCSPNHTNTERENSEKHMVIRTTWLNHCCNITRVTFSPVPKRLSAPSLPLTHILSQMKTVWPPQITGLKQPACIFFAPIQVWEEVGGQIRWGLEPTGPAGRRIHLREISQECWYPL